MKLLSKIVLFSLAFSCLLHSSVKSQQVIDQILAVVGNEKILLSDIEQEVLRMKMQGFMPEGDVKCEVFEDLLIHKLLLHHARLDSIPVNSNYVEGEMERRIRFFTNQVGSEAALEKYFNKTIFQIKDDLRQAITEAQLTQQMQEKIVDKAMVTPTEVKRFFRNIPNDSLPTIPEQFEYRQIVLYPPASAEAKYQVREKLLDIRERILKGERFATLAVAYSEDRASATRGGELGFRSREELVKSFADVAFNLKEGQVSQIVETEYGFHLIQMIEKRGEQVNVRHILLKPTFTSDMLQQSHDKLDSIAHLINSDSLAFSRAAQIFSQDEKTRLSGGLVINQQKGTSLFEKEQLNPADFYIIRNLKVGQVSEPFESRDVHANVVHKIIVITRIIPQHKATLNDDYAIIQSMAKMQKQQELFLQWIKNNVKKTYIRIDPSFRNCDFELKEWVK